MSTTRTRRAARRIVSAAVAGLAALAVSTGALAQAAVTVNCASAAGQLVRNCSFEQIETAWVDPQLSIDQHWAYGAATGGSTAVLHDWSAEISQTAAIPALPAGATGYTFSFSLMIRTNDPATTVTDTVDVYVGTTRVAHYTNLDKSTLGYTTRSFTLPTTLAGTTQKLRFKATQGDDVYRTSFAVDNVSLLAS